jgi:hypothetical protein
MYAGIGDIWDFVSDPTPIVIPTNIGWTAEGKNVMGRGLAKQAAERCDGLARWYGDLCRTHRESLPVVRHPRYPLIMFPVKPLDIASPYLSWKQPASLQLIERSCTQVRRILNNTDIFKIYLPLVGCGNGGLEFKDVYPILNKYLNDPDKFALVLEKKDQMTLLEWRVAHANEDKAIVKCGVRSCSRVVEWGSREWTKEWAYHWIEKVNRSILVCPTHLARLLQNKKDESCQNINQTPDVESRSPQTTGRKILPRKVLPRKSK